MVIKRGTEKWEEFIDRLHGAEACNFEEKDGQWVWKCGIKDDRLGGAKKILAAMGFDVDRSLAYIQSMGHVCCDCEIIFNRA